MNWLTRSVLFCFSCTPFFSYAENNQPLLFPTPIPHEETVTVNLSSIISDYSVYEIFRYFVHLVKQDSAGNHDKPPHFFYDKLALTKVSSFEGSFTYESTFGAWGPSEKLKQIQLKNVKVQMVQVPWHENAYEGFFSVEASVTPDCRQIYNVSVDVRGNSPKWDQIMTRDLNSYAQDVLLSLIQSTKISRYCK